MIKTDLHTQLKHKFQLTDFRPGQEEIINDVMDQKDVLGILPTGSGKSLCYQLPASLSKGVTIVVSPLISLMEDQVKQLKASGFKQAAALNSLMFTVEKKEVLQQLERYKLIYLSPELLQNQEIIQRLQSVNIDLFVVDEAHCISQWGHEFRPDYLRLGNVLKQLQEPPVLALSATATKEVQKDIIDVLDRPDMIQHIYPMDRDNITFTVERVSGDNHKKERLIDLFNNYRIPTLIYFSSKRKAEEITVFLTEHFPYHRISFYHGDMEQLDRITVQQQFMNDQLDIICCTSAFGMGINKQDIRLVIHYHFPLQIESFLQESGRAGRDGQSSVSLLLYAPGDEVIPNQMIENELPQSNELHYLVSILNKFSELPAEEQLLEILQLSETQWRFLHYQLERNGIIDNNQINYEPIKQKEAIETIKQLIERRTQLKIQKVQEMINWIHEDNCLRAKLYAGFQDSYKEPAFACCSNCDFSFHKWHPQEHQLEQAPHTWETKLKQLLLMGD